MNKVILMGRLTRDAEIRYSQGENSSAVARFSLAVDRRFQRQNDEQSADFINCVAFGRDGEFAEKYLRKGSLICVQGRIQTGSYTNKDGVRIYTTDVIVDYHEFVGSRNSNSDNGGNEFAGGSNLGGQASQPTGSAEGFMPIPDGIDEELPFA